LDAPSAVFERFETISEHGTSQAKCPKGLAEVTTIAMKDGSHFGLTDLWENWRNPTTGVAAHSALITVPVQTRADDNVADLYG